MGHRTGLDAVVKLRIHSLCWDSNHKPVDQRYTTELSLLHSY